MKECSNFQSMVVVQRFAKPYDTSTIPKTERFEDFLRTSATADRPDPVQVDFQAPVMVYYSSGTTGTPKAIVLGTGPVLLNVFKEGVLHRCLSHRDVAMQYTTTGWIMYLLHVAHLIIGSSIVVYDGSPFMPDIRVLLRIAAEQGVTNLGVNPRWMSELMKNGVRPRDEFDLSKLHIVTSTGMVLPERLFEWFYDVAFPKQVRLGNTSGGTEIVSGSIVNE